MQTTTTLGRKILRNFKIRARTHGISMSLYSKVTFPGEDTSYFDLFSSHADPDSSTYPSGGPLPSMGYALPVIFYGFFYPKMTLKGGEYQNRLEYGIDTEDRSIVVAPGDLEFYVDDKIVINAIDYRVQQTKDYQGMLKEVDVDLM